MIYFGIFVILVAIGFLAWAISYSNKHYPPPQPEKKYDPVGDILEEMKRDTD